MVTKILSVIQQITLRGLAFVLVAGFFLLLLSCVSFDERVNRAQVITDTENIRDAEAEFRKKHGRYGSIEDLLTDKLLDSRLRGARDADYVFKLEAEEEHYTLIVAPDSSKNHEPTGESLSLYLDDSGIIRASIDSKVLANPESRPISPK